MSTLSDRRSIIIKRKPETCVEEMVKIIEGFPKRLHATDAYDRIETRLAGRVPFDRKGKQDQVYVGRARKKAGYGSGASGARPEMLLSSFLHIYPCVRC